MKQKNNKMKSMIFSLLTLIVLCVYLTGCAGQSKPDFTFAYVSNSQEEAISEQTAWEKTEEQKSVTVEDNDNFSVNGKQINSIGYSSADDVILALDTGRVNGAYLQRSVAEYLCIDRNEMHVVEDTWTSLYQMAALLEQSELMEKIDAQLTLWQENGTLDMLVKTYLDEQTMQNELPDASTYTVTDWPIVKVAVTGGLPPLDYVSADGTPAGFNIAMLTALSEELHIDFQPVVVETDARMTALATRKVDILFWVTASNEALVSTDSVLFSNPYYEEKNAYVTTDKYLSLVEKIAATP